MSDFFFQYNNVTQFIRDDLAKNQNWTRYDRLAFATYSSVANFNPWAEYGSLLKWDDLSVMLESSSYYANDKANISG